MRYPYPAAHVQTGGSEPPRQPSPGALLIVERARGPIYYAKWRDSTGCQVKRWLGRAWVERGPDGAWRRRKGRPRAGELDERGAIVAMAEAIAAQELALDELKLDTGVTFADAAEAWLHHVEYVKGIKPTTIADYRYYLAPADAQARRRGRPPAARIMRRFGHRPLARIGAVEIAAFLGRLDEDGNIGPRTVNKYRQVLHSIFEYAMRPETFGLRENPVARIDKRREPAAGIIDFYEPEEVFALARVVERGLHRDPTRPAVSEQERVERQLADERDATLFLVAAFTGLRMGELLALQWRHVNFSHAKLVVEASWSGQRLTTPKSGKWRVVPLADQPAAALEGLSRRDRFTAADDLVFCSSLGGYLDQSALRRRYRRAQQAAGLRELRFHDLRHSFGSLVIREFDPVSVKSFMAHSKITTTERYLHARSRRTDALRLTKAFTGDETPTETPVTS